MQNKIRVGLIGARAETNSWGARAHVPAIKASSDYELKAVCTAHDDTAKRAAESFGIELAYGDYHRMFENPDIDLISIAVRVPSHHPIALAALEAGKHVYCEWPLGRNLDEAEQMAGKARELGLHTMAGLQGRSDPSLMYLRELISEGYVGDVLTCQMTLAQPGSLSRASSRLWTGDYTNGANTLTITGGHSIDALCFCLGEFVEVSARLQTQVKQVRLSDSGEMADVTSPDNILVSGVLESGALASIHIASVPYQGSGGWRLEIYGREGTIFASGAQANYSPQPIQLIGARGDDQMAEMPIPESMVLVSSDTPVGGPFNVAQAYTRFAESLRGGPRIEPDFETAVRCHRLLSALERSSMEQRAVKLA